LHRLVDEGVGCATLLDDKAMDRAQVAQPAKAKIASSLAGAPVVFPDSTFTPTPSPSASKAEFAKFSVAAASNFSSIRWAWNNNLSQAKIDSSQPLSSNRKELRREGRMGQDLKLGRFISILVLLCVFPVASASAAARVYADPAQASQLSLSQAKQIIEYADRHRSNSHLRFGADVIHYEYGNPRESRPLCPYEDWEPWSGIGDNGKPTFGSIPKASTCGDGWFGQMPTMEQATKVAAALLRWKSTTLKERQAFLSNSDDPDDKAFDPVVAAYRSATDKPMISEDVHRYGVIAEAALKDGRFGDAANAYEDALDLAPWWPEGQFNAALALGELYYFDEAILHMKRYLKLAPDAPDARAAQDKIYIWEGQEQAGK